MNTLKNKNLILLLLFYIRIASAKVQQKLHMCKKILTKLKIPRKLFAYVQFLL